ncbi:MAG: OprO/OprP family phosphate-selective porin [Candidatus Marinimicrobia bacterium]|nr:OprO/OprP family phosphate-selective porin [Candidatus Neomarinimicrobiota bacterium]MCF7904450.1 OprO/OprP family phosphate-selective porin [Candidatus Neomarinimicrobiota bacterium]
MQQYKHLLLATLLAVSIPFSGGYTQTFAGLDQLVFNPKTTIGGYGEMHYNQVSSENGSTTGTLDFHRFVLFYSHAWTEKWSFKSEVELEHNFVKSGQGELELEQAFVDYHHSDAFGIQTGVILPSVGFINEYHEPPLFFGVERPDYAKYIIPTTWFGNGAAVYGTLLGVDYRVVLMEGLDGIKFSPGSGLRSGRQKGYKAEATHPLVNLKLESRAIDGMIVGGSFSHMEAPDTLQGISSANPTTLTELHLNMERSGFIVRGEFGQIHYGKPELVSGVRSARGYYLDLGYDFREIFNLKGELIPWFRYSDINTAAVTEGVDAAIEADHHNSQWMIGLQLKPIPQVVYKLDYGKFRPENGTESTLFNLGVGYMF